MEQPMIASLQDGNEEPFVLFWPPSGIEGNYMAYAHVVIQRPGGFLLAVPVGFIPLELPVRSPQVFE